MLITCLPFSIVQIMQHHFWFNIIIMQTDERLVVLLMCIFSIADDLIITYIAHQATLDCFSIGILL
jgi:hypothetical protein